MRMEYSTIFIRPGGTITASDCYRFFVVLRGNGRITAAGVTEDISLHMIFSIPQDTICILESDSGVPFSLGCIEIRDHRSTAQRVTTISAENSRHARQIFYLGLDLQDCSLPYYDTVNAALHQLMFSTLIAAGLSSQSMNAVIFNVIEEINDHFTESDFDLRSCIDRTGYTVNHFRKIFKDEVGVTPTEFVNSRRLERAEELLTQYRNRIPIKDIAVQCGFQDPYYFSRQFKKWRGVSPQAFVESL